MIYNVIAKFSTGKSKKERKFNIREFDLYIPFIILSHLEQKFYNNLSSVLKFSLHLWVCFMCFLAEKDTENNFLSKF
jgi:hypothetical protein